MGSQQMEQSSAEVSDWEGMAAWGATVSAEVSSGVLAIDCYSTTRSGIDGSGNG